MEILYNESFLDYVLLFWVGATILFLIGIKIFKLSKKKKGKFFFWGWEFFTHIISFLVGISLTLQGDTFFGLIILFISIISIIWYRSGDWGTE